MVLRDPVIISSSLRPCVRVGGAEVCVSYSKREGREGRTRYEYQIFLPDGSEFTGDDLQSGCQGGDLREGLESLLSFLGAAAESWHYRERTGRGEENIDLFPKPVVEWAARFSDELGMAQMEVEETPDCIEEKVDA